MSRYFVVHISGTGSGGPVDIYLTDDGSSGGRPCRVDVPGAANLLTPASGNTTVASDGTAFTEKPLTAGKGRPFEVVAAWCTTSVYEDLKDLIDYVVEQETEITVEGSGEPGDFDVQAIPNFAPVPIEWEGFTTDVIKGLRLRFITTEVNT